VSRALRLAEFLKTKKECPRARKKGANGNESGNMKNRKNFAAAGTEACRFVSVSQRNAVGIFCVP
jgi:hypothetical protein